MSSTGDLNSPPSLPPDSPGSSVSSYLQEEYDELMKYAVVVPNYGASQPFETGTGDLRSFPRGVDSPSLQQRLVGGMSAETGGSNTTPRDSNTTPSRAGESTAIVPGQAVREEETIITITSKAPSGGISNGDSSDNDTLVEDTSKGSRGGSLNQPGYGQSVVMRDIFPDISDDDVRSGQSQARSGQEDFSREHSGRQQTTEKKNVSDQRFFHPSFLSGVSDSMSEASEGEVRRVIMSTTIDPDTTRMENLLDQWCLDLRRNVLAEYGQSKIRIIELGKIELQKVKEKHAAEMNDCQNEVETLKELLHTYEQSVQRKDQVISNLTRALQKNKEKVDMMKKFNDWKLRHNDCKREAFASNLARSHYERKLAMKVWAGWHSVIETKWQARVEKACQAKAQEVCVGLTNDYEARISALTEALESARQEVSRLHTERERYEEMMKKAFMRGVCALNLEAMSIFQGGEEAGAGGAEVGHSTEEFSSNFESNIPQKDHCVPKTIPQEAVYREEPLPNRAQPRVVGAASHVTASHTTAVKTTAQIPSRQPSARAAGKTKTVSTRITSKVNTGLDRGPDLPTLAPPMSTVMVERHQPVVKQTVGHATASKYPVSSKKDTVVSSGARAATVHRKIAGQTGGITPHVQSVKIVE